MTLLPVSGRDCWRRDVAVVGEPHRHRRPRYRLEKRRRHRDTLSAIASGPDRAVEAAHLPSRTDACSSSVRATSSIPGSLTSLARRTGLASPAPDDAPGCVGRYQGRERLRAGRRPSARSGPGQREGTTRHGRLPTHRRPWADRGPPDRSTRDDGGVDRLVLRSSVRLAEHLRGAAGPRTRRTLPAASHRRGLHEQAAVLPRHGHPRDPFPHGGRRRRGGRLHADQQQHDRRRHAPHRTDGPLRARRDDVRPARGTTLRLRARAARDTPLGQRCRVRRPAHLDDDPPGARAGGRAPRAHPCRRPRRRPCRGHPAGRA